MGGGGGEATRFVGRVAGGAAIGGREGRGGGGRRCADSTVLSGSLTGRMGLVSSSLGWNGGTDRRVRSGSVGSFLDGEDEFEGPVRPGSVSCKSFMLYSQNKNRCQIRNSPQGLAGRRNIRNMIIAATLTVSTNKKGHSLNTIPFAQHRSCKIKPSATSHLPPVVARRPAL